MPSIVMCERHRYCARSRAEIQRAAMLRQAFIRQLDQQLSFRARYQHGGSYFKIQLVKFANASNVGYRLARFTAPEQRINRAQLRHIQSIVRACHQLYARPLQRMSDQDARFQWCQPALPQQFVYRHSE